MGCFACCRIKTCFCCSTRIGAQIIGFLCVAGGIAALVWITNSFFNGGDVIPLSGLAVFFGLTALGGFCCLLGIWTDKMSLLDYTLAMFGILLLFDVVLLASFAVSYFHEDTHRSPCNKTGLILLSVTFGILLVFAIIINSYKMEVLEEDESEYQDECSY